MSFYSPTINKEKKMEVLEQHDIELDKSDTVARRRLNTSKKLANITAADINKGVTCETLQGLNVPAYFYSTQCTLHGKLPDLRSSKDSVWGYKWLVRNNNGTIGIKYIAVDAEKKDLIRDALWRVKDHAFSAYVNSQGFYVYAASHEKEKIAKLYAETRSTLEGLGGFRIRVFHNPMYGIYYLDIRVDTIPQRNFDAVLNYFKSKTNDKTN